MILVAIENGVVREITTSNPSMAGTDVVISENGVGTHYMRAVVESELGDFVRRVREARSSTASASITRACEIAGDALLKLARTAVPDPSDPGATIRQIAAIVGDMNQQIADAREIEGSLRLAS